MVERILGSIRVFTLDLKNLIEHLTFTTDRVIVVKITKLDGREVSRGDLSYFQRMQDKERELSGLSAEELLRNDDANYAIPMSEIIEVRLTKPWWLRARYITILTKNRKYRWQATGIPPIPKVAKTHQFIEILQPVFAEKLSIKPSLLGK